jgi:hypothetical protein
VQVDGRTAQGQLGVGEAAHGGDGAGQVRRGHPGVADDDHVAGEPVGALAEQLGEVRGTRLLLALDEQLHGDGRGVTPGRREVGAHAEQVEGDIALVVDRAAGVQLGPVGAVDDGGLERWVHPQLGRVHRLDVVVAVDERDRGTGVGAGPFGEDRGRAGGRPDLDGREPGAAQRLGQPRGAVGDVGSVRGVRGDRRDAQPGVEIGVQVLEVGVDEIAFGAGHRVER